MLEDYIKNVTISDEKNILVDYVFDYQVIDNQNGTHSLMIYDEDDNAYKLGDDYSSYEEVNEAITGFKRKLDELLNHSEEIIALLKDSSY